MKIRTFKEAALSLNLIMSVVVLIILHILSGFGPQEAVVEIEFPEELTAILAVAEKADQDNLYDIATEVATEIALSDFALKVQEGQFGQLNFNYWCYPTTCNIRLLGQSKNQPLNFSYSEVEIEAESERGVNETNHTTANRAFSNEGVINQVKRRSLPRLWLVFSIVSVAAGVLAGLTLSSVALLAGLVKTGQVRAD